jgi:heptosyltransferase II
MHFVLLRFSSLGDIVMQTAFVSWLKSVVPDCYITFVTSKEFVALLEGHAHVDRVEYFERAHGLEDVKNIKRLGTKIDQNRKIDFIIDLHGTTRSFLFKFLLPHIPVLNPDKRRLERFLLVNLKIDLLKHQASGHERNMLDWQGLFRTRYKRLELEKFVQGQNGAITSAVATAENSHINLAKNYIVVAPVASFATKRWPMQRFTGLVKKILEDQDLHDFSVYIVAGPKDDYVDEINQLIEHFPERLINFKGKSNLKQTSQIIAKAKLLVGNDSGMGHIAESYGVPVVSIFGPTSESFGFKPHLEQSVAVSVDLWCRPCSTTGKKKCYRSQQYCMENVTIEQVLNLVKLKMKSHENV